MIARYFYIVVDAGTRVRTVVREVILSSNWNYFVTWIVLFGNFSPQ